MIKTANYLIFKRLSTLIQFKISSPSNKSPTKDVGKNVPQETDYKQNTSLLNKIPFYYLLFKHYETGTRKPKYFNIKSMSNFCFVRLIKDHQKLFWYKFHCDFEIVVVVYFTLNYNFRLFYISLYVFFSIPYSQLYPTWKQCPL